MSGMIIHIDDFGERELLERRFEVTPDEVDALLQETDYSSPTGLQAELVANLVGTSIRVHGRVHGEVKFDCGRCLEPSSRSFDIDADFVLMEASEFESKYTGDEIELEADDLDVSVYSGEKIDLAPFVREAILLELPAFPRCPDEAQQSCDEGYRRNVGAEALESLEEAAMDQRWAPLKNIKLKD